MKKLKTLALVFALAAMVFYLGTTADAASDGSITIKDTQVDYTYNMYKIFNLQASDDYTNVIYTIDEDWVDFFLDDGDGAAYLIPQSEATDEEKASLNRTIYDGDVYYINITSTKTESDTETGNVPSFADAALAYAVSTNITIDAVVTGTGDDVTVTGLELGYYLIYPFGASILNSNSDGSVCSLTSTLPGAEVVIKAEDPTIDKTVDDYSVELGQTVTFTLTGKVPDTTGYSTYTYQLIDVMSDGLDFDGLESITIMFGDTDITDDINWVVSNSHPNAVYAEDHSNGTDYGELLGYTSSLASAKTPYATLIYDGTGSSARVIGFLLYFEMLDYQDYVGEDIVITYTATVNDDAVAVISDNEVELKYSNNPQHSCSFDFTHDEEEVYSARIIIDKYDGDDEEKLEGAKFVLYKVENGQNLYYYLTDDNVVTWVSDIDEATVMTTDTNGAAQFDGLEDGTYYLKETAAPGGYNLLEDDVEVVIAGSEIVADQDANGEEIEELVIDVTALTSTESIENYSGTSLPETGGIGTTIFYVIGGMMILGAAVFLVTRRTMGHVA